MILRASCCFIFLLLALFLSTATQAQNLRVVSYNLEGRPNSASHRQTLENILAAIGAKSVFGTTSPVDLMAFQEGPTDDNDFVYLRTAFENVFGGSYDVIATDVDGMNTRTGFVYNTDVLTLEESWTMGFGMDHNQMIARFSHASGGSDNEFWIYSCHFTEGSTSSNINDRLFDALNIAQTYNQFGLFGENYIWTGTFGIEDNMEDAYQNYIHGFDQYDSEVLMESPLFALWSDSGAYLPFHTTEPSGLFGGMRARPDFFSICRWLIDEQGMEFVQGSTTIMGNNGTHLLFDGITTGSGDLSIQSDLITFSDHLPLFSDYQFNQVNLPVNDFHVGFATESFIVQPAGPRTDAGGIEFFNIEGDANGQFASFGILDFDLTDEIGDKETIFHTENLELVLSQANAGFSANGPYRVYLCSPSATNALINKAIQYQSGNNGLDCVPPVLADGAIPLRTYPGIHRNPDGSLVAYRSGVHFRLNGPEINPAFRNAVQNNGKLRLLFVPLTSATAATFAGVGHLGTATPPRFFADSDIETVFNPESLTFDSGSIRTGSIDDLSDSENVKMVWHTNNSIVVVAEAVTRSFPREKFEFTFEASVRSTTPINQKVELYNFELDQWEVVDERIAAVLGDRSITVQPTGTLYHYRDGPVPGVVRARITFTRQGLARGIRASVDHVEWRVR